MMPPRKETLAEGIELWLGDCREILPLLQSESVHCVVTSPPYFGLRDYGVAGQLGLELSPAEFVAQLVAVFREVRRVLRSDGTLWLNLGDSYAASGMGAGLKPKDLIGIPWRVAFALQDDGWYLRQDIIWSKPNPMPESVRDRCTKAHEYLFMLSKSSRYFYDGNAIAEDAIYSKLAGQDESGFKDPRAFNGKHKNGYRTSDKQRGHSRRHAGFNDRWDAMERAWQCSGKRNKRSVWTIATQGFPEAHFATFPPALIEPCILAGCQKGGTVLDPFLGAGTTMMVADRLGRQCIGIELSQEYGAIAKRRFESDAPLFIERPPEPKQEAML